MGRTAIYATPRRVNIIIEESEHEAAQQKAKALGLRGGFSEYVARLIKADKARKGRAIAAQLKRAA